MPDEPDEIEQRQEAEALAELEEIEDDLIEEGRVSATGEFGLTQRLEQFQREGNHSLRRVRGRSRRVLRAAGERFGQWLRRRDEEGWDGHNAD